MAGRVKFFPTSMIILLALVAQTATTAGDEYVPKKKGSRRYVERQSVAALLQLEDDAGGSSGFKPFRVCRNCTCCAQAEGMKICRTMPCCFGIKCDYPEKPFGVCSFNPISCNCANCSMK